VSRITAHPARLRASAVCRPITRAKPNSNGTPTCIRRGGAAVYAEVRRLQAHGLACQHRGSGNASNGEARIGMGNTYSRSQSRRVHDAHARGRSLRLQWPPAASVRGRPWGLFLPSLGKHPIDGGTTDLEGLGNLRSPHAFWSQLPYLGNVNRWGATLVDPGSLGLREALKLPFAPQVSLKLSDATIFDEPAANSPNLFCIAGGGFWPIASVSQFRACPQIAKADTRAP
jgi:hypothetical protein